ncbi:MAG: integrase [Conexibacter sp.]|nr:integrase [Conexibacter sp.]
MAAKKSKLAKTKTPGVYRRGKKYVYAYRVRGVQRWKTVDTYEEARRGKLAAEVDVDRGELRDLSRVSFGDYAGEWIVNYQGRTSNGFRGSTRRAYTQMLEARIIPYFDGRARLRLAEIEPRDVKAFVRWMNEQEDPRRPGRLLGKSWIRQHIAVLRALLGDAMEEAVIRHNPAAGVRVSVPEGDGTAQPRSAEKRAMTIDELRRVVAEVPARWKLLFEFMAHTGLRIGEVSELRWGRDVILTGRPYVKLRWQFADDRVCETKTRYGKRDIPLSPGLVRKLTATQPPDADGQLVLPSTRGTRLNRNNLQSKVLGPTARRADVPWVTLHTFRHTCASLLFAPVEHGGGGKNAKQVQEWLGHHSPAYTLKEYVHLIDAGVGEAIFFDAVLGS